MAFLSLLKLSYQDAEQYEAEYLSRSQGTYTVHLNFSIHGAAAFYEQTPEISNLMLHIYKTERKIDALCNLLPGVAINQFRRRCLIDEIVLTNDLEGVVSTRKDVTSALDSLERLDRRKRFHGLVRKYFMLQEDTPMASCRDIRDIYDELVLEEVRRDDPDHVPDGNIFRKDPVYVYSGTQRVIHTGLYPESEIIASLEKALAFLNDDSIEPLIRISIFHYLLGYIHPFYDGNGRLSRFISSSLLSREIGSLLGYRLSYTIRENVKEYYEAFKVCNHPKSQGELTFFLDFFLRMVDIATDQLHIALLKRADSLKKYSLLLKSCGFVNTSGLSQLGFLLIQGQLFSDEGVSTQELLDNLKVSRTTLAKWLSVFDTHGLLLSTKAGTKRQYGIDLTSLEQLSQT